MRSQTLSACGTFAKQVCDECAALSKNYDSSITLEQLDSICRKLSTIDEKLNSIKEGNMQETIGAVSQLSDSLEMAVGIPPQLANLKNNLYVNIRRRFKVGRHLGAPFPSKLGPCSATGPVPAPVRALEAPPGPLKFNFFTSGS